MLDTTNIRALNPAAPAATRSSSPASTLQPTASAPSVSSSSPARNEQVRLLSITVDLDSLPGAPSYWGHFKRRGVRPGPGSTPMGVPSVTRVASRFFMEHNLQTGRQEPAFPVYVRVPAKGPVSTRTIFRECWGNRSEIDEYLMDGLKSRDLHKEISASRGTAAGKRERSRSTSTSTSGGLSSGPLRKRTHV